MTERITDDNQVQQWLACSLCLKEIPDDTSPAEYSSQQAGWTRYGLQIWCNRHGCNVINLDFEGRNLPAVTSRKPDGFDKTASEILGKDK
jgi:hypothetical protein